jgi:hypothetical protein
MKNSEQPAFTGIVNEAYQRGLTKREYFALLTLQGLLSNSASSIDTKINLTVTEQYVISAIKCADELLKQLDNEK